jgi:hypothetical protein
MGAGFADRGQCLAGLSLYQGRLIVTDRLTTEPTNVIENTKTQEADMVLLASNYDQSRFLNAVDLAGEKKFRIKEVTEEEVGQDKDKTKKLVVWFTNDKRGLVLNKTNNRTLRGAFGDDCSNWKDKIVVVFPTMVDLRGRMVPGLRVRIPAPKQAGNGAAQAKPAPAPVDDNLEIPPSLKRESPKPKNPVDPELDELPVSASDPDDEIPF